MRVYDKRVGKIIRTKTNIPDELMAKKDFLLPVEWNIVKIEDTETTDEEEGLEVLDDKVIETRITRYHVDTLEEVKEKKIGQMKSYVEDKFPVDYKQRNASMSVYSEEENIRIIDEVKKWDEYVDDKKLEIDELSTIEEVNDYEYRTDDDVKKAEEMDEEMMT